ncbi:hypothetical protein J5U18_11000 [Sphingobacteriaceae bacterium WQ 2009]|uniref:Uncharacterized protein n=1 Tax=Rhinopithecimicrobium faecis TaxID=2820698 RepID=A0A8T4HFG3_9SPHI|nr:hypothetical protein [Sphingobacteriaceae bacterium WQ 2009]
MSNSTKTNYIPPTITCVIVQIENSLANSSVKINPGGDQSDSPQIEDWIEEVDNHNLNF